jgi:hypothetical protein
MADLISKSAFARLSVSIEAASSGEKSLAVVHLQTVLEIENHFRRRYRHMHAFAPIMSCQSRSHPTTIAQRHK